MEINKSVPSPEILESLWKSDVWGARLCSHCLTPQTSLCPHTVYSSGKNNLGQLGRPKASTFSLWKPVKVEFPRVQTIIQIAASGAHSVALTASGLVYVWGKSLTSQSSIYTPTCVDLYFGSVDHVAIQSISLSVNLKYKYGTAYTPHILALTQDNKVYAWGKESRGQCGIRIGFFIFRAFLRIIGYCLSTLKMKAL